MNGSRFLYVEIGHSGSESDHGIFPWSTLQKEIARGTLGLPPPRPVGSEGLLPYFLVGDEAFLLKKYMMRPYPRRTLHEDSRETPKRRVFNYRLSRARRVIENAFGILAQQWRIPQRPFKAKTDNINRYVGACIVLHNFLMKESSASSAAYCPPGSADSEDWEGRLSPGSWREEEQPVVPSCHQSLLGVTLLGMRKKFGTSCHTTSSQPAKFPGKIKWSPVLELHKNCRSPCLLPWRPRKPLVGCHLLLLLGCNDSGKASFYI
nr:uncharacterized protein LOC129386678 [Dermacentor andersoni]XP_054930771.1 uncharacterized protein LOC129386678 [Dermacentor andersoni]